MNLTHLLPVLQGLPYFTKQNLALAINKEGENLNYWIKKLTQEGLIIPLKKGFYIAPQYAQTNLKTLEEKNTYGIYLANTLCTPSYVSLEYALSYYSIIPESAFHITSVTTKSTRQFRSPETTFFYRHIPQQLFNGYQTIYFELSKLSALIAEPFKALCDFLYLKPFASRLILKDYLINGGRINWDAFESEQKKRLANQLHTSKSVKLQTVFRILTKEHII